METIRTFEWDRSTGPSESLIESMAEATESDPAEMEPLYHSVDPDCLDRLFAPRLPPAEPRKGTVRFEYMGYLIEISANGTGYILTTEEKEVERAPVAESISADGSGVSER